MKIELPSLDLSPENVKANVAVIKSVRAQASAFLKALDGLASANQAMCPHEGVYDCHDPGYAGGGWDGQACRDCGARSQGYLK